MRGLGQIGAGQAFLGEPVGGEVNAADLRIFDDVARDVGELEGDAEIGGAVERVAIAGIDAHDMRHHHPHRAGDLIAVAEQFRFVGRAPADRVAGEPGKVVDRKTGGDRAFGDDQRKGVERGEAGRLSGERGSGLGAQEGDAPGGIIRSDSVVAEGLAVGDIVARAAPGIEQPTAFAGGQVEDLAGETETLAAARNRPPGLFNQPRAIAHASIASCSRTRLAVASALPTTPGMPAPGCVPAPTK